MGLHKPQNILSLEKIMTEKSEVSAEDEIKQLLLSVDEFGVQPTSKDNLHHLSET